MDTTTPTPERLELSVMRLIPDSGGKIEHVTLSDAEVGQRVSHSVFFLFPFLLLLFIFIFIFISMI